MVVVEEEEVIVVVLEAVEEEASSVAEPIWLRSPGDLAFGRVNSWTVGAKSKYQTQQIIKSK